MRGLIILAAVVQVLSAASLLTVAPQPFTCDQEGEQVAAKAALHFINEHHHHGYKFQLIKVGSSTVQQQEGSPCELLLDLGLDETKCHIVSPKPIDQCEVRTFAETKVGAKCNVTVTAAMGKPVVTRYACNTEPASADEVVKVCPDCPNLVPLHEPEGLERVKAAIEKYNEDTNHTSYFKLMEVGRLTTQWVFVGQSFIAEFAIVETNCSDKVEPEERHACKPLCQDEARHGFCESSQIGNYELFVECELFDAQNSSHHHAHHGHPGKGCKPLGSPGLPGHPGMHIRPAGPPPGHHPHPPHGHSPHDHPPPGHPPHDHPPHGHPPQGHPPHSRPPHGRPPQGYPPHSRPQTSPTGPRLHGPAGARLLTHKFPFPHCHGFVKIPPSIHPICPYPPPRLAHSHGAHTIVPQVKV